jgi:hypothetical protein
MSTFEPDGWTVTTGDDGRQTYTKDLGLVQVVAEWDPSASLGTITVDDVRETRYATGIDTFRDAPGFWIAANLVADTAAAPLPVTGHIIGDIKVDPGNAELEADLDFTLDDGREIGLSLIDSQAFDLTSDLYKLDKYVWDEERDEVGEEEDDPYEGPDHGAYKEVLPHVTAEETLTLVETLTKRFGADRDAIDVSGGGSWIVVTGKDIVTGILGRQQEFDGAIGVKWRYTTDSRSIDRQCLKIEYYPKGQFQEKRSR